jgi:hypothetical protein
MPTFPALKPSGRTFTPGDYPNTPFKAWTGVESRVRHSNVMLESTLRLTYTGINETQMLSIMTHYQGQRGGFESFVLPADVWSGVSTVSDYSLTGYRWCYIEPPTVADLPCGNHIVELSLATVPPEGVSVNGLSRLVAFLVTGGNAAAANGLAKTITWDLQPGVFFTDGLTEAIIATIQGGPAEIVPNGIAATVSASLQPGQVLVSDGIERAIVASILGGAAVGGGPADANYSNVSLLLHMDGSNGSATFTDNSPNTLTLTAYGGAQISTAQSKFGGASGLFDGNGDYVDVPADADLDLGTGNFTIEFWFYPRSNQSFASSTWRRVIAHPASTNASNSLQVGHNAQRVFMVSGSSNSWEFSNFVNTGDLSLNTWYHIAFTRSSSTLRCFLDGVQKQAATISDTYSRGGTEGLRIGNRGDLNASCYLDAYLDDLRITKGVARYTSNFTPPTAAFPDS